MRFLKHISGNLDPSYHGSRYHPEIVESIGDAEIRLIAIIDLNFIASELKAIEILSL